MTNEYGFEIPLVSEEECKLQERIEELEAENERLTVSYETLKLHDEEEIGMLKSENAELKTRVENQKSFLERIRAKFNLGKIDRKEIEDYLESDQLTKAKELLKQWLQTSNASGCDNINIVTDTKQFISEVEK